MKKYLQIKNWYKYQQDNDGNLRTGPWIKSYWSKYADKEYLDLSITGRYIYDGIRDWTGEHRCWIENDPKFIFEQLHINIEAEMRSRRGQYQLEDGLEATQRRVGGGLGTPQGRLKGGLVAAIQRLVAGLEAAGLVTLVDSKDYGYQIGRVDKSSQELKEELESKSELKQQEAIVSNLNSKDDDLKTNSSSNSNGHKSSNHKDSIPVLTSNSKEPDARRLTRWLFKTLGSPATYEDKQGEWEEQAEKLLEKYPADKVFPTIKFCLRDGDPETVKFWLKCTYNMRHLLKHISAMIDQWERSKMLPNTKVKPGSMVDKTAALQKSWKKIPKPSATEQCIHEIWLGKECKSCGRENYKVQNWEPKQVIE